MIFNKTNKKHFRYTAYFIFFIFMIAVFVFILNNYDFICKKNLFIWDVYTIQIPKIEQRDDNPWGFSAGLIDFDEEQCVFATPGTKFTISDFSEKYNHSFLARLHPAVCDVSDGVYLNIQVLDKNSYSLTEQELFIPANNIWIEINIEDADVFKIIVNCSNNEKGNENGDWVIFKSNSEYISSFAEEGYVRSATYFENSWPLNFWNSETENIDRDFKQIRDDGFNSIILVIPWKEFQSGVSPIKYNDYPFKKLEQIMNKALLYNLDVYTRIGYLWDYYNDAEENCINRFIDTMQDEETYNAWIQYCKKMYSCLSEYENFKGAFISWEDFWKNLTICDIEDPDIRIDYAKNNGYQKWIGDNYSLKQYNELYDCHYSNLEEIPVPSRNEAAMESFYRFFDDFLNVLLKESQDVFPNLSMEIRLDDDLTIKNEAEQYYSHNEQYSCENSDYTVSAYGIPMCFDNIGEKVSAEDALKNTERIIKKLSKHNKHKPIYIDQFLFSDNTPRFSYNAQIIDDQIGLYLDKAADILSEHTRGYGIWTYRNYRNNMLYNPQFGLYDSGWIVTGNPIFQKASDSITCTMKAGDTLFQEIPEIRDRFSNDIYTFSFDVLSHKSNSVLKLCFGDGEQLANIDKDGHYDIPMKKNGLLNISIELLTGSIEIDDLCLYSHIQDGQLYDENNNELELISNIRKLNEKLKSQNIN